MTAALSIKEFVTVSNLECSLFARSIFSKSSRIKFVRMFDLDDQYYIPRKDVIIFPCQFMRIEDHDLAHMVEMNNFHRLLKPDWGMKTFSDNSPSNSEFFAALSREIRVRAISLVLRRIEKNHKRGDTSYDIFGNSYWEEGAKLRVPFGRFKTFKDVQEWAEHLRDRTLSHWNLDRIESEWFRRMDFISNWMETT